MFIHYLYITFGKTSGQTLSSGQPPEGGCCFLFWFDFWTLKKLSYKHFMHILNTSSLADIWFAHISLPSLWLTSFFSNNVFRAAKDFYVWWNLIYVSSFMNRAFSVIFYKLPNQGHKSLLFCFILSYWSFVILDFYIYISGPFWINFYL